MTRPAEIFVYRSNRAEALVDALAGVLEVRPSGAGILEPECIVVQGRGMAVWLSLELSRRQGIFANGDFVYPRKLVERAFTAVLGESGVLAEAFDRERLVWSVLAELPLHLHRPEFEGVARYVRGDESGVRAFQIAQRIARTFDDYLTYRPDLLRAWEQGRDGALTAEQAFQPPLWRGLALKLGSRHTAALEREFLSALSKGSAPHALSGFPRRIAVFGLSTLPPLYVRVLSALSLHIEVHLFVLSPSREYWADLPLRGKSSEPIEASRYFGDGNPLLVSFGLQGAEFQKVLIAERESLGVSERELTPELHRQPPASLLGRVQADLLHLRSPRDPVPEHDPLDPCDGSIAFHACHGPMREVEVLHDQLLALFSDGSAEPRDVVVMMPDVEAYAPLIEAVFDRDPSDARFIPYHIADRRIRSDSPVLEAVERVLSLAGGRKGASEVLDLLTLAPLRLKFAMSSDDVETITQWVVESGVRWGVDAADRERHGQPSEHGNTWQFGLTRLLLGYAMPGGGRTPFQGTLSYDEIEGSRAELLGRFAEFCNRLFTQLAGLERARPLEDWQAALGSLLTAMIPEEDEMAWQSQQIRTALAELVRVAEAAGYRDPLDLHVVRSLVGEQIEGAHPARAFLAGGVTFCAMVPMRSIPFRIVCLLGMNDGAFPRNARPVEFDLIARDPSGERRLGDRSRRHDDRYLFLEAILSARDRLLVTYTGRSIRDDTESPPSVVVSELLDYLVELLRADEEKPKDRAELLHRLVVRHPLQAFSPRYFDGGDPRLFSYAEPYLRGAQSSLPERREPVPLFVGPLPCSSRAEGVPHVAIDDLVRFFEGPIAFLLRRRLQVDLRERDLDVPDREPLLLDPLDRYRVGAELLDLTLEGASSEEAERLALLRGELPAGAPGKWAHEGLLREVLQIVEEVRPFREDGGRDPLAVDRILPDGTRLSGTLSDRFTRGLVRQQFARVRGKHLLGMWVRHLVLTWMAPGEAQRTVLVGRSGGGSGGSKSPIAHYVWKPVREPEGELTKLVRLFQIGQEEPLLLFPRSSLAYADELRKSGDIGNALRRAHDAWADAQGELRHDPFLYRVFGEQYRPGRAPPFPVLRGGSFEDLAQKVFQPLLDHQLEEGET